VSSESDLNILTTWKTFQWRHGKHYFVNAFINSANRNNWACQASVWLHHISWICWCSLIVAKKEVQQFQWRKLYHKGTFLCSHTTVSWIMNFLPDGFSKFDFLFMRCQNITVFGWWSQRSWSESCSVLYLIAVMLIDLLNLIYPVCEHHCDYTWNRNILPVFVWESCSEQPFSSEFTQWSSSIMRKKFYLRVLKEFKSFS